MAPLTTWANFYIIIGSSAGALTGLMFVVISLSASRPRRSNVNLGIAAFNTPTIVHFGSALFVCAFLSAPWSAVAPPALLLGLCGLAGVAYVGVVVRRVRRLDGYSPVLEDWVWNGVLPLVAYVALAMAALLLSGNPTLALFGVGIATTLLVFIGIHNAWDVVTYLVIDQSHQSGGQQDRREE